ncbi:MAG: hypothetical protein ACXVDA_14265 [Ktedonobacterales bacterium]
MQLLLLDDFPLQQGLIELRQLVAKLREQRAHLDVAPALLPALCAEALAGGHPARRMPRGGIALRARARHCAPEAVCLVPRDSNLQMQPADIGELGDLRAAAQETIEAMASREPPDVLSRTRQPDRAGEERERYEEADAS